MRKDLKNEVRILPQKTKKKGGGRAASNLRGDTGPPNKIALLGGENPIAFFLGLRRGRREPEKKKTRGRMSRLGKFMKGRSRREGGPYKKGKVDMRPEGGGSGGARDEQVLKRLGSKLVKREFNKSPTLLY